MEKSIIEESRGAKHKGLLRFIFNKRVFIIIVVIAVIGGGYYFFSSRKSTKESVVELKEFIVKTDDIKISIESDGKVVAEDGVELSFSVSGDTLEVEEVFVQEGDPVKRGDNIATVKTDSLEFELRNAYASYENALASLNAKRAEPTQQEVDKAKASIESAQIALDQAIISLEQTKKDAEEQIKDAEDTVKKEENAFIYLQKC